MAWDPFSAWPNERRWLWLTFAGWVLLLRGPAFVENLQAKSSRELIPDFFQKYALARNGLEGLAIYEDQYESVRRHLGTGPNDQRSHIVVNVRPPSSVLLTLP